MIQYGLLLASVMLETTKNIFSNRFSKEVLKNETDIYKFNTFLYFASFLVLLFFPGMHASGFTVGLSVVFAAVGIPPTVSCASLFTMIWIRLSHTPPLSRVWGL